LEFRDGFCDALGVRGGDCDGAAEFEGGFCDGVADAFGVCVSGVRCFLGRQGWEREECEPEEPPMTRTFLPWSLLAYLTWSGMVVVFGVGWVSLFAGVFLMDGKTDCSEFRRQ
jgi:hypothetical protein